MTIMKIMVRLSALIRQLALDKQCHPKEGIFDSDRTSVQWARLVKRVSGVGTRIVVVLVVVVVVIVATVVIVVIVTHYITQKQ